MLWLPIDRNAESSLINQIYQQIRNKILTGELKGEERLPSSRQLASDIGVSRNVILEAYEQLHAEGFLITHQGSGTYVAKGAYLDNQVEETSIKTALKTDKSDQTDLIDFRSGIPALDLFPRKTWGELAKQASLQASHSIFGYDHPEGRLELREVLSRYLLRTRGVRCSPDQIVITSGATQAFSLLSRMLLSDGGSVLIEDPITSEIQTIFMSYGSSLFPIPVDEDGMKTEEIPSDLKVSFTFITPSHQFPLGAILPIQRRIQLIQFARETDSYIVEDDYDSEFRYEGQPIHSLQGLDPHRVIYVGTFSKILSPALRMGYLVLPYHLVERFRHLKWFTDLHTPSLEQYTFARFIEEGYLDKHILKMKRMYKKRRDHLIDLLKQSFSNQVKIMGESTGLHLVAHFENIAFTDEVLRELEKNGVRVYPVEDHSIHKGNHMNKVILGYGNVTEKEIETGMNRIKKTFA